MAVHWENYLWRGDIQASDSDIAKIENEYGILFPKDYLDSVKTNQGKSPSKSNFSFGASKISVGHLFYFTGNEQYPSSSIVNKIEYIDDEFPDKVIPKLVERRTKHAEFERSGKLSEDANSVGVSKERLAWMKNKSAPLAFTSPKQFERFKTDLNDVLNKAGLGTAPATMKGTSTTFYSENPKKAIDHHFDKNPDELADVDIGIGGSELNKKMQDLGYSPHPKIKNIYKTRDTYEAFPELRDFADKWEKELGREVNFVGLAETDKIGISNTEYILH